MTTANISAAFAQQTSVTKKFVTQKGQINRYRLRPAILNEHVETARQIQGVVSSGNSIGQIFKACENNINGIILSLESAAGVIFDDFESYADSAALQAVWIASAARLASLEETIVAPGGSTKAFSSPSTDVGDEWVQTIVATDYTGYTGFGKNYQTHGSSFQKVSFFIGDGTNTKSIVITAPVVGEWFDFEVLESNLTEDGGGTTDIANITKVGYRVEDAHPASVFYADNLIATPPPGSIKLKLWDMGEDIPVDGVTGLNDGTQYENIGDIGISDAPVVSEISVDLIGGKREYDITNLIAGVAFEIPDNVPINQCNYYALIIEYVDTNVNVYGADTSFGINYYENGYAFSVPDEVTPITKLGEFNDIQFQIFSAQDVYVNTLQKGYDAAPGNNAVENIRVEGKDMNIEGVIFHGAPAEQTTFIEFKDRLYFLPKGGKFEINHNDDFQDSVSEVNLLVGYMFEPPEING